MFRITEDPSSGSLVQCLAKNYKNDSIVSVDMDKFTAQEGSAILYSELHTHTHAQRVRIRCHNTDHVHVNGHDRTILVIFSQTLYKAPG
jgi:hypothetical protein